MPRPAPRSRRWASTEEGIDPDVVLAAAGMVPTNEVLAAAELLRHDLPALRVRVVNVMDLMRLDSRASHPHALAGRPIRRAVHDRPSRGLQLPRLPLDHPSADPRPGLQRTRFHVSRLQRAGRHHDTLRHAHPQWRQPLPAGHRRHPPRRAPSCPVRRQRSTATCSASRPIASTSPSRGRIPKTITGWRWNTAG